MTAFHGGPVNTRLLVTASLLPLAAGAALVAPILRPAGPLPEATPMTPPLPPPAAALATVAPLPPATGPTSAGGLHVAATPDRDLVYAGDGQLRVKLEWWADAQAGAVEERPTDLVVVLDRSGSMAGDKLEDARAAARALVGQLGPQDRITMVSFASDTRVDFVDAAPDDPRVANRLAALQAGGGTEMLDGLRGGLAQTRADAGRVERMVLVSDGLPNQAGGLTALATQVLTRESALTAIGIGADYDEALLQSLADAGGGSFYWARQGAELEQVLAHELRAAKRTAARSARLRASGGAQIVDAGGLHPDPDGSIELGTLFAGQRRAVWLTIRLPPGVTAGEVDPGALSLSLVTPDDDAVGLVADLPAVQVTPDAATAYAQLGDTWAESVVVDRFNGLRTEVSASMQRGDLPAAQAAIARYRADNALVNAYAQNPAVEQNLQELTALEREVADNFVGPDAAAKRNLWSKTSRSDAYSKRRSGSFVPAPAPAPR